MFDNLFKTNQTTTKTTQTGGMFSNLFTKKEEPTPFQTIVKLQGGGVYKKGATPEELIKTERTDYGGFPTKKGYERADIVPVSLGGVNADPENITYEPYSLTEKVKDFANKVYNSKLFSVIFNDTKNKINVLKQVAGTDILPKEISTPIKQITAKEYIPQTETDKYLKEEILPAYKSGKMSLQEARAKTVSFLKTEQEGIKQGTLANLPSAVGDIFAGTTEQLKSIIKNPLSTPKDFNEFKTNLYNKTVKQVYETDKDAMERVKNLFLSVDKTPSQQVSAGIKATAGAANVLFTPITALFGAAENIPVIGTLSKLVTLPFTVGADVGKVTFEKALDTLPINQKAKSNLKEAVGEIGSLAGMLVIGGKLSESSGDIIAKNKPKLIEKFGKQGAETIIEKAQEKAQASAVAEPKTPFQLIAEKAKTDEAPTIELPKEVKPTTPFSQIHEQLQAEKGLEVKPEDPLIQEARKYKTVSESKFGVRFGEEVKDRAIQLYKEGKSSTQISKEMGISSASVLSWTEKAGIKRTISQSKVLYEKDIPKVIELYKQGKNTTEISKELNLVPSSVARWVKEAGITRSNSEAQSILAELGKTNVLGVRSKVSTKFGVIPADSTYEAIRIKQLEADPNIVSIKRATRIPFGENRHYVPDIEIKYKDGSTIIEEIKPVYKLGDEKIIAKEKAAKEFYKDKNTEYRIITENDIGVDAFKNANLDNITFGSEEIKLRFLKAINKAKSKTKSQLTDIWNKAQEQPKIVPIVEKTVKPTTEPLKPQESGKISEISPTGEVSGVAKSIESKAIEKGMVDKGITELPEYDASTIKKQSELGSKYSTEQLEEIARSGELPEGMKPATPLSILEDVYKDNPEKLIELAKSPLTSRISESASEVSLSRMREKGGVVETIKEVIKNRRENVKEKIKTETKSIKEELKKSKPTKDAWISFVDSIVC